MTRLKLVGGGRKIRGTLHGIRQPSFVFSVQIHDGLDRELQRSERIAEDFLRSVGAEPQGASDISSGHHQRFIDLFLDCVSSVLLSYHHPVFHAARIMGESRHTDYDRVFEIQQPCLDVNAALGAIILCTDYFAAALDRAAEFEHYKANFAQLSARPLANLKIGQLKGFNTLHFLRAAHDLDVPWLRLSGATFQAGYGRSSRLLNSSFTDRTSCIGNNIAKNKFASAKVLKMAGLPVARQITVPSRDHALDAAREIGFPVVVKPIDCDGGQGVTAYLTHPEDVAKAYDNAAGISDHIVVEKHVEGKDYRVQVVEGEVHGIVERTPGGITGDGMSTVADLITRQNLERKQALDDRRFLHPIEIDIECRRMLRMQGLTLEAIPSAGTVVRLRGAANVASGGVPAILDMADVHADNIALAVRATRVLRLDVAGVDLITPDIGTSWLEVGAAICEMNAQPQMFTTFHRPMLEAILGKERGHIPICLVLEAQDDCPLGRHLFEALASRCPKAGSVSSEDVCIGSDRITAAPLDTFDAVRSLLVDPLVEGLVLSVPPGFSFTSGWPFDRCDAVVSAMLTSAGQDSGTSLAPDVLEEIGRSLRPHAVYLTDKAASRARGLDVYGDCLVNAVDFEKIQKTPSARSDFARAVIGTILDEPAQIQGRGRPSDQGFDQATLPG